MKNTNARLWILSLLWILLMTGCATITPQFHVNVDSLSTGNSNEGKNYILIPGNEGVNINDLQFKEYALYINRVLISLGYISAKSFEKADLAIFLSYGIGDPQEHQYSYSLPVFGQTGVSSANTYGTLNSFGNYSSVTTFTPTYGVTGYTSHAGAYSQFFRFMLLETYDLDIYRKSKKEIQVWKTMVTSTGSSGDLRMVFPILVAASKPYIGSNTGQQVKIILDENDQSIIDVKTGISENSQKTK